MEAFDWPKLYGAEKRYYTLNHFLKEKFGGKVFKLSVDGGFTCPNRDGTKGYGGCIFCSAKGSGDFIPKAENIAEQMQQGIELVEKKWKQAAGYIAYFQSFSNTYAPISILRERYDATLNFPGVLGLAIATRPDCITEEIADLLAEYAERTFLWVELGLQSLREETMAALNLGYTKADFLWALQLLQERKIPVCVHVILGLPGENVDDMRSTVQELGAMGIWGLKLHMLHIVKGTVLGHRYAQAPFKLFALEEYVPLVCDLLEILPPEVIIHRLTGDGPKALTLAPRWTFHKLKVLSEIDRELKSQDSFQGKFYRRGQD